MHAQISQWEFVSEKKKFKSLPFKECWLITLKSLEMMLPKLLNRENMFYICGRRLNQDFVENVFCQVRNDKGSFNENPDSYRAVANLRAVAASMYFGSNTNGSNCEDDEDIIVFDVHSNNCPTKNVSTKNMPSVPDNTPSISSQRSAAQHATTSLFSKPCIDVAPLELPNSIEMDVIHYIAGHLLYKFMDSKCSSCHELLIDNENFTDFIHHKQYNTFTVGLLNPSVKFQQLVFKWESKFRYLYPLMKYSKQLSTQLFSSIAQHHPSLMCPHHTLSYCDFLKYFIKMRIYHEVKLENQKYYDEQQTNLRKASKLFTRSKSINEL